MKVILAPGVNNVAANADPRQELERAIDIVHAARDAGFDGIRAGHHWLHPWRFFQPLALFARIAPEAGDMDMITVVFLLPQHNPFDIAEQCSTLDIISNGHFKLGVGLGYREVEFEAAGMEKKQRVGRMEEAIGILRRLWAGEEFTYRGRHFRCTNARIGLMPLTKGGPPIYMGGASEAAARRAGRIADGWTPVGWAARSRLLPMRVAYKAARREAGKPGLGHILTGRYIHIARTRRQALDEAREYMQGLWNNDRYRGGNIMEGGKGIDIERSWEEVLQDRVVVGTVDEVVEGLIAFSKEIGITHLSVSFNDPRWPHQKRLDTIKFLGKEVLPHLHKVKVAV